MRLPGPGLLEGMKAGSWDVCDPVQQPGVAALAAALDCAFVGRGCVIAAGHVAVVARNSWGKLRQGVETIGVYYTLLVNLDDVLHELVGEPADGRGGSLEHYPGTQALKD